jgi:hypothetical protein
VRGGEGETVDAVTELSAHQHPRPTVN